MRATSPMLNAQRENENLKSSRPYGKGLEETAAHIAMMPRFYDDEPRPVRQHASPPSDHEIRLAFAVMLDMADRIDEFDPGYCDARTVTGRAVQAALLVALAYQAKMRHLWIPATIAAGIVIELIGKFLAAKRTAADERSQLRNISALLLLGGISSYKLGDMLGDMLGSDPSALRRRINADLDAIEHRFGHLCKNNKALRKTWRLPQRAIPTCYNNDYSKSPLGLPATDFDAGVEPDFDADELSEALSHLLFDDD
jgi:hypothetical protein